jgi:hypothetical protein
VASSKVFDFAYSSDNLFQNRGRVIFLNKNTFSYNILIQTDRCLHATRKSEQLTINLVSKAANNTSRS